VEKAELLKLITRTQIEQKEELDLAGLGLTALPPEIGCLVNLKRLLIEGNDIAELPDEIWQLEKLEVFWASNNQLTGISQSICKLPNLKTLSLSNNKITIIPEAIGYLENLEYLNVSSNQIKFIPGSIGYLSNLQQLDCSDNAIEVLPAALKQLSQLRILNLDSNPLQTAKSRDPKVVLKHYFEPVAGTASLLENLLNAKVERPTAGKTQLQRIQIPQFRALKNIDLFLEPDLTPAVFPLTGGNGSGKSTLLQLVFTLLHCTGQPERIAYLQNMIQGFPSQQLLAHIDCRVDGETVHLEFASLAVSGDQELEKFIGADAFLVCQYPDLDGVERALICRHSGFPDGEAIAGLAQISQSIFLATPITQSFRFMSPAIRDLAFRNGQSGEYYQQVATSRRHLTNFFAWDLVAVDLLIQSFKIARDDDFKYAITHGCYGDRYQCMLKDIEKMLVDKRVNIDPDLNGVCFFQEDSRGQTLKLHPEDLSHGELKRLSLYIWLKFNKIENAIVLIDEVELALNPDWQAHIVADLQSWAPSNQYILATHSAKIGQPLAPNHSKEIVPTKKESPAKLASLI
jgi:energy-coupling factor transporter ATP-binding protein EcfA2